MSEANNLRWVRFDGVYYVGLVNTDIADNTVNSGNDAEATQTVVFPDSNTMATVSVSDIEPFAVIVPEGIPLPDAGGHHHHDHSGDGGGNSERVFRTPAAAAGGAVTKTEAIPVDEIARRMREPLAADGVSVALEILAGHRPGLVASQATAGDGGGSAEEQQQDAAVIDQYLHDLGVVEEGGNEPASGGDGDDAGEEEEERRRKKKEKKEQKRREKEEQRRLRREQRRLQKQQQQRGEEGDEEEEEEDGGDDQDMADELGRYAQDYNMDRFDGANDGDDDDERGIGRGRGANNRPSRRRGTASAANGNEEDDYYSSLLTFEGGSGSGSSGGGGRLVAPYLHELRSLFRQRQHEALQLQCVLSQTEGQVVAAVESFLRTRRAQAAGDAAMLEKLRGMLDQIERTSDLAAAPADDADYELPLASVVRALSLRPAPRAPAAEEGERGDAPDAAAAAVAAALPPNAPEDVATIIRNDIARLEERQAALARGFSEEVRDYMARYVATQVRAEYAGADHDAAAAPRSSNKPSRMPTTFIDPSLYHLLGAAGELGRREARPRPRAGERLHQYREERLRQLRLKQDRRERRSEFNPLHSLRVSHGGGSGTDSNTNGAAGGGGSLKQRLAVMERYEKSKDMLGGKALSQQQSEAATRAATGNVPPPGFVSRQYSAPQTQKLFERKQRAFFEYVQSQNIDYNAYGQGSNNNSQNANNNNNELAGSLGGLPLSLPTQQGSLASGFSLARQSFQKDPAYYQFSDLTVAQGAAAGGADGAGTLRGASAGAGGEMFGVNATLSEVLSSGALLGETTTAAGGIDAPQAPPVAITPGEVSAAFQLSREEAKLLERDVRERERLQRLHGRKSGGAVSGGGGGSHMDSSDAQPSASYHHDSRSMVYSQVLPSAEASAWYTPSSAGTEGDGGVYTDGHSANYSSRDYSAATTNTTASVSRYSSAVTKSSDYPDATLNNNNINNSIATKRSRDGTLRPMAQPRQSGRHSRTHTHGGSRVNLLEVWRHALKRCVLEQLSLYALGKGKRPRVPELDPKSDGGDHANNNNAAGSGGDQFAATAKHLIAQITKAEGERHNMSTSVNVMVSNAARSGGRSARQSQRGSGHLHYADTDGQFHINADGTVRTAGGNNNNNNDDEESNADNESQSNLNDGNEYGNIDSDAFVLTEEKKAKVRKTVDAYVRKHFLQKTRQQQQSYDRDHQSGDRHNEERDVGHHSEEPPLYRDVDEPQYVS